MTILITILIITLAVYLGLILVSTLVQVLDFKKYKPTYEKLVESELLPQNYKELYEEFGIWDFKDTYITWHEKTDDFSLLGGGYIFGGFLSWTSPYTWYWHNKMKQVVLAKKKTLPVLFER